MFLALYLLVFYNLDLYTTEKKSEPLSRDSYAFWLFDVMTTYPPTLKLEYMILSNLT